MALCTGEQYKPVKNIRKYHIHACRDRVYAFCAFWLELSFCKTGLGSLTPNGVDANLYLDICFVDFLGHGSTFDFLKSGT